MLLPYVPPSFKRYHEPFVGGGAMLFGVHRRGSRPAIAADLNEDLTTTWQAVIETPSALHQRLLEYESEDSEAFYYEIRSERYEDPLERAAHFLYLNRTAWNGLYRVNRWGVFNVPWGARAFAAPSLEALEAVARELAAVSVRHADFREVLDEVGSGDFVYLDPPYLKVSDTSKFNGYTKRRFVASDLAELAAELRRLTQKGARWLLSNRDSAEVRELFAGNEIVQLTVRRSVAAQNRRDIEPINSPEVIVSNRPAADW
jgi:DNA adenine methylase